MDFKKLKTGFEKFKLRNEDDVKIHFYADIIRPLLQEIDPKRILQYFSEDRLLAGGRTDATFQHISFEFKKEGYFDKQNGINEALFGRNRKDHGLQDYIISHAQIKKGDNEETIVNKLRAGIGIGFDGKTFIFARFVPSIKKNPIDSSKVKVSLPSSIPVSFYFEHKDFLSGIRRLALLLRQKQKMALNKENVLSVINTKSSFVRQSISTVYQKIEFNLNHPEGSSRVKTLFKEWDRVFGILYGEEEETTDFTEVNSVIREYYGIDSDIQINGKRYLFAMQTFFNIFLKLLIYSFLSQVVDPTFSHAQVLSKAEIDRLFDGTSNSSARLVDNFFESHFLEWFTYTDDKFEEKLVRDTLEEIDRFDLTTFVLKPEDVQDILQEVYMELIPAKMRHLMGEYFSPDWIVEHVLDVIGYEGDINKTLMDPCAGSGPFLTQAIKRIIAKNKGVLGKADIERITTNIVGFDINPISVVAAKTNYILIIFSAFFDSCDEDFGYPIHIPVFIADSILAPVVYSEENKNTLRLFTSVGVLELPKFQSLSKGNQFLIALSSAIHEKSKYENFLNYVLGKELISEKDTAIVKKLFDHLYVLHRSGKDSFWPIILRNSFAPIMIGNKFDFVVGNPPWIAWKSMSKSYREGTLSIWKSYGIFEKNAYDKKTTHDDFGMAVTYVAIDQYLKNNCSMIFLLPASFLKSTKGGEGFRKLEIIRNGQDLPVSIDCVHDFSAVNLFTVPTVAIKFTKNKKMKYPMSNYCAFTQIDGKSKIDAHESWEQVSKRFQQKKLIAQPVDSSNRQSAWLTLPNMDFATKVLDTSKPRFYKGRKGIEPAGAKGVYILTTPRRQKNGKMRITNDISRQRRADIRDMGAHSGLIEETYIYPMLGGRNISRWKVKSNEFILVPHSVSNKYGIPEKVLAKTAPDTFHWLSFYHDELLKTRIQNGKFFNEKIHPFYRLDNVGDYTYSKYKVLWKEQTGSMAAVVVGSYYASIPNADKKLFKENKIVVVDSKVLMLATNNASEAYYVCGIMNAPDIVTVIDGYAISTNRGVDVLKYLAIPKYNEKNKTHKEIASLSKKIHTLAKANRAYTAEEQKLNSLVHLLFA